MNSKGHLYISLAKSVIRIYFCILALILRNPYYIATGFIAAEVLGIFEELVDKR